MEPPERKRRKGLDGRSTARFRLIRYPLIDSLRQVRRFRGLLAFQFILATSALYEIAEWIVASVVSPELGAEFIGAQGDPWDSPEDMAAALLGSALALLSYRVWANRSEPTGETEVALR